MRLCLQVRDDRERVESTGRLGRIEAIRWVRGYRQMARKRDRFKIRGKTLVYAVRDRRGRFKDIQLYRRSHLLDLRKPSKAERRRRRRRR